MDIPNWTAEDRERIAQAEVDRLDKKQKVVDKSVEKSKMESGAVSGARNPFGEKAKAHAERYYGLVRSMTTDVSKIAKVTNRSEEEIQAIKDFIFIEKHDLGNGKLERFEPDFMMAESWKRLQAGVPEPHDITMINHEIMERELMLNGMSQSEAHRITSKVHNYSKEATDFYDKIEKYSKE